MMCAKFLKEGKNHDRQGAVAGDESPWEGRGGHAYLCGVPLEEDLQAVLYDLCDELGLEEALVLGLIQTESGFVTDAVNPVSGCYGLCQLNPLYFPGGLSPEENLRAGLTFLAQQMERYDGDEAAALTAYNAGRDTGDRSYASRVLENRKGWEV